jgi:uncharacterized damage-inducible protein DinB
MTTEAITATSMPGISMKELLDWDQEASAYWKSHLDANPALLDLPCGIGSAATVQEFVRHIWGVELRWAQRLAGLPQTPREDIPAGPVDALYDLHMQAAKILDDLLADPAQDWSAPMLLDIPQLPESARSPSRRKVLGHTLLHSQRHWAQLATLVRVAGFPSGFRGDLLACTALA